MGFLTETDTVQGGLAPQVEQPLPFRINPDFFKETLPAAFNQFNTIANVADYTARHFNPDTPYTEPDDPNHNPFADIKGYEEFADFFVGSRNATETAWIKHRIDTERTQRQTLADAGAMGVVASLAAGIFDPINLIPIAGMEAKGVLGGRILSNVLDGAKIGLLSTVATEPILQADQITRTARDAFYDIAGSTVAMGVLGAAVGMAGARLAGGPAAGRDAAATLREASTAIDKDLTIPGGADPMAPGFVKVSEKELLADTYQGSVGAAAARDTTLAEETLKNMLGVEKGIKFLNPMLRGATSPNIETRRFMQELAETPLTYGKNAVGLASPVAVETKVKLWQSNLARAVQELDQAFIEYRTGKTTQAMLDKMKIAARDVTGRGDGKLTFSQFKEEVGRAMIRDDQHPIPQVARAAKAYRREVFDPLKQRAIETGMLPDDVSVKTAASYLTRVYNRNKILAQRPQFEDVISNWLRGLQAASVDRIAELEIKVPKLAAQAQDLEAKATLFRATADLNKKAHREGQINVEKAKRDVVAAKREFDRAQADVEKARARLEKFKPDAAAKDHPIKQVLRDLKHPPKPPQSLADYVKSAGGIVDEAGEIKQIAGGSRGLVNNKSGRTLDDMALKAWEEGFFPGDTRPSRNEFLTALDEDVRGTMPSYRAKDEAAVEYQDQLAQWSQFFDENNIDINKLSADEIIKRLDNPLLGESPDFRFTSATSANKARFREIQFNARNAAKRVKGVEPRLKQAREKLREAKAKRDEARQEMFKASAAEANIVGAKSKTQLAHERAVKQLESERGLMTADDAEIRDIARQITDNVTGNKPGRLAYEPVPLARGPMKERVLDIADQAIEPWLERDIEHVARVYHHTMSADVELAGAFGRTDMQGQLDMVRERYAQLRKGVTDEKQLLKLDQQMRSDIRDLEAVRDRIRGTYALPDNPAGLAARAVRVVKSWNYIRLLGGMTLSAVPDLGRSVMMHGFERTVGDGLKPLVKNFKGYQLAAKEVTLAGTALDMVLDSRAMQIADIWDDYGRLSKFERGVQAITSKFGIVSLMAPWNAALKQFAGVVTQTRMLQAITGKSTAKEVERLAMLGIDADMSERIAAQFRKHGEIQEGGLHWANTDAWTDGEAVTAFRAALVKDVDAAIVTPGHGDRPLWMSSQLGQIVGQFKGFSMASTQRVALAGLQQRDAAALNGLLLSVGLGMLSYTIKVPQDRRSDNIAQWVAEGFDRSGVLGILSDTMAIGARTFGVGWSGSRYQARGPWEMVLGPTYGLGQDAFAIAHAAADMKWSDAETKAARRLVPYQNLFYLRWLFDQAEAGLKQ